jgi:internalin A
MQAYEQAVFISYAWGGEREEIVNQIDEALQKRGIKIIRDKRDLGYKGSITGFMERIGQGNCVIVVISDKYLRSPNCMFELVEFAENKQFHDRIFPVVLADADIYDPVKRIAYVKHWEIKRAELAEAIKTLDPANLQGIREDMDLYDRIRDRISGLASILKDMNTLTPDMHRGSDFSELYDSIVKRMQDIPATLSAESHKDEKKAEGTSGTGGGAKAKDGSIGIGSINIGGNASGNIVIGNNNQVNNSKES